MKLFGKRKKTTSDAATTPESAAAAASTPLQPTEENENVSSYFSSDFKPPSQSDEKKSKVVDHDIEKLLAMDPASLNAKQRRVLKRHQQRNGDVGEAGTQEFCRLD